MTDLLDPKAPLIGVILRDKDGTAHNVADIGTGGGGGGPATIIDGGDVTQGAKADAAASADTGTFSVVAILKRIVAKLTGIATNTTGLATETTLAEIGADIDAIETNTTPPVASGTQGNLWSAASVAAGDVSAAIHLTREGAVAVFGHCSAANTLGLVASANGTDFYTVAQADVPSASDFGFTDYAFPVGIYLALYSGQAAVITATLLRSA